MNLATSYVVAMAGAFFVALIHDLIQSVQMKIRHGLWLVAEILVGLALVMHLGYDVKEGVVVLAGMAGVFSFLFRRLRNAMRGLPWYYLGPIDRSIRDSVYDGVWLFLWKWKEAGRVRMAAITAYSFEALVAIAAAAYTICN